MNEFEHALLQTLAKHGMSLEELAEQTGYNPIFFADVVSGKSRKVPVDFFVRLADALDLSNQEKDALVRSWAFGVERWSSSPLITPSSGTQHFVSLIVNTVRIVNTVSTNRRCDECEPASQRALDCRAGAMKAPAFSAT